MVSSAALDAHTLLRACAGLAVYARADDGRHVALRARFVLRDNVLMYFNSPKDFTGFRDKPSGVVLLEEGNVRTVETGALQKYTFMLAHPNGESVVLAAETEKEMHEWMQAGASGWGEA